MIDSYVTACKELATHVADGVYGAHEFIAIPRSPSEAEKKVNRVPNYVWPDLYFLAAGDGTEAVYVKVRSIPLDTLLPFGGELVTHWEYLARKSIQAMAVATWIPVEDPDLDGRPLWYIPGSSDPRVVSLHTRIGAAGGKRSKELNMEIVWSVFGARNFRRRLGCFTALCETSTDRPGCGVLPSPASLRSTCGVQQLSWLPQPSDLDSLTGSSVPIALTALTGSV